MTAGTDLAGIVLSARERETNIVRSASLTCESQEKNTRPKGQEQPEPIDAETGSAGTSGWGWGGGQGRAPAVQTILPYRTCSWALSRETH